MATFVFPRSMVRSTTPTSASRHSVPEPSFPSGKKKPRRTAAGASKSQKPATTCAPAATDPCTTEASPNCMAKTDGYGARCNLCPTRPDLWGIHADLPTGMDSGDTTTRLIDHEARPSLGSTREDPSLSPEALVDERNEPSEQPPRIFAPAVPDPGLEPDTTFARPLQTLLSSLQRSSLGRCRPLTLPSLPGPAASIRRGPWGFLAGPARPAAQPNRPVR